MPIEHSCFSNQITAQLQREGSIRRILVKLSSHIVPGLWALLYELLFAILSLEHQAYCYNE